MSKKKLYVWREVLCDYTCGIIFTFANSPEEARKKVLAVGELGEWNYEYINREPEIFGDDEVEILYGGG